MDIQTAVKTVIDGVDLDAEDMLDVMRAIMTGESTAAQIGGFLVALRMKGETIEEIAAAARVMRDLATRVEVSDPHLVDIVGTGGDSRNTFNISTACAFVAAAAGAKVAKHGNRSVSSKSGSADVLEAAGARIDLDPAQVARCINEIGVGFMFAPRHHGAMKHAIGPRRELGVRTIFNVLGPLTNPAGAQNQLLGVFSDELVEPLAQVLAELGSHHVLVVHAADGMDEISISADTHVVELRDGAVCSYTVSPEQFGLTRTTLDSIVVGDSAESLQLINDVYANATSAARDIVALNSGAAIYAADLADSVIEGVARAQKLLASGAVAEKFEQFVAFTNSIKTD
ncbi:MAG: anthranilate phosphoribosyltransferase [Gammaproteobacteria bacterium]|nr:anthranilate phosphoribosyltransferase [Gammaproteobacteria bacterium]MDH3469180.1 anthranilate phosphoribosyltransferase [Gammaproteobacteria bacterium]